jgi:hypothetical protein
MFRMQYHPKYCSWLQEIPSMTQMVLENNILQQSQSKAAKKKMELNE